MTRRRRRRTRSRRRSSRPTTSAASTARRWTSDTAYLIGRAFARVLGRLRGKEPSELRVGLGRDMRLQAPAMAARLRDGLVAEGVDRARRRDGRRPRCSTTWSARASSTAARWSPPRTTRRPTPASSSSARARWRSPATRASATIRDQIEPAWRRARRRLGRGGRHLGRVPRRTRSPSSTPTVVKPMKVVVDGGNGMAGPMVGPILERLGARAGRDVLRARRRVPRPRAQPAAGGEPASSIIERVRAERRRPRDRLGRRRRPLLLHRRPGRVLRRRLHLRPARPRGARARTPARRSSTTSALQPRRARHGRRRRRALGALNRVGHAFFKARDARGGRRVFGGEVSGHYYFRDFWNADSGTIPALLMLELLSRRRPRARRADRRVPLPATSSPARSTPRSRTPRRRWRRSPSATPTPRSSWLDGVSVDYPDWHFNVRPSNTEPLLRLNLESLVSREDMEAKRDEVLALIRA